MVSEASPEALDRPLLITAGVVVLGSFMTLLDTTIVNVAIPTLGGHLHAPLSDIQWVTTGYLLALSIAIPLTGWCVARWGEKTVWITCVAGFTFASLLCAASWSVSSLIVFRCAQGAAGGMIVPVGQSIVAQAAGPRRMGRVMSIVGAPTLLAPILGPVVGGLIVQFVSWRLIFLVNLPIGILGVVAGLRTFKNSEARRRQRLDVWGFGLLAAGSALIVYSLSRAGASSSFTNPLAIATLAGGISSLVAFAFHARRRGSDALIDTNLLARSRTYVTATILAFVFAAQLLGTMLLLSIYFQDGRGQGALWAGLLIAPQGAGAVVGMLSSGWLTDRVGAGWVTPVAIVIAVAGTTVLTQAGHDPSLGLVAGALFVRGVGLGAALTPATAAALATIGRDKLPQATTLLNIVQRIGGAIGTTLIAVILASRLGAHEGGDPTSAFGDPFWVSWALLAVLIIPALGLPRRPAPANPSPVGRKARGTPMIGIFVNLRRFTEHDRLVEVSRRWESLGADGVVAGDHLFRPDAPRAPVPEAHLGGDQLTLLTIVAASTERMKVATMVSNAGFQHPVLLIRKFAQLASLYGGQRVYAGFGAGWARREFDALGLELPPHVDRLARLGEALHIARELYDEGFVDFEGLHITARRLPLAPRPKTPPHVLVAGGSPEIMTLAGKYADHIDLNVPPHRVTKREVQGRLQTTVTDLEASIEILDQTLKTAARDRLTRSIVVDVLEICADDTVEIETEQVCAAAGLAPQSLDACPYVLLGSPERIAHKLTELRERLGLTWIVVPFGRIERFAAEVAPLLV